MKLYKTTAVFCIFILEMLAMPLWTEANEQWHFQASVTVSEPGLVEAALPAGIFFGADAAAQTSHVDLSLIGPDGNPRSFELYWKEDNGPRIVALKSTRVLLDKNRVIIWEADVPKELLIETIKIDVATSQTLGKVTIEGKDSHGWHVLAENAALYKTDTRSAAEIEIKPAVYEQLRLSFKGYDKEFRETPLLVRSVILSGKSTAKDYVEKAIELRFSDKNEENTRVISSLLPGSGLWIRTVFLSTEAQFQGTWELGQEVVTGGKLQFLKTLSGSVATVGKKGSYLELPFNDFWRNRSLVLRLNSAGKYVGDVKALGITVNLPRMTFYADKAGTYLAQTGGGNQAVIQESPGDKDRKINRVIFFSDVSENKQWVPERLAEKYSIAGGPFNENGFRWKARVPISEAGYYRLVLNREASMTPNPEKVRLVRDAVQIPYFRGPGEEQKIELAATAGYDKGENRTSWTIVLPDRARNLTEMSVESQGIFDRQVMFEIPKQGRAGWQPWKTIRWQNVANASSVMRMGLADLPRDVREMRITMDHGDNRPIDIRKIHATFDAPTLLFLIHQPGEYTLYGGNESSSEAKYDLALVQAHLVDAMPKPATMGSIEPFSFSVFKYNILRLFDDKSWGLYLVLGLVTIVLMILIVKLFPKEEKV